MTTRMADLDRDWVISIRDPELRKRGELVAFEKLTSLFRKNQTDTISLSMPADQELAGMIDEGWGWGLGIGSKVLSSGPFTSIDYERTKEGRRIVAVTGVSDDVHLGDRVVYPSAFPFTSAAYDVRSGSAESLLHAFANANLGPGASSERRLAGLTFGPNGGRGASITERGRLDDLDEFLRAICLKSGTDLGFRIRWVANGVLEFQTYVSEDRSNVARFSLGNRNLESFKFGRQAPTQNVIIVGGQGEGTARVFRLGSSPATIARWGRRIESFRDRRDTDDNAVLVETAREELTLGDETMSLAIVPIDIPGSVVFGEDYSVGDLVGVELDDGTQVAAPIEEIKIELSDKGEQVVPVIGSPQVSRTIPKTFDRLRRLAAKVASLEKKR